MSCTTGFMLYFRFHALMTMTILPPRSAPTRKKMSGFTPPDLASTQSPLTSIPPGPRLPGRRGPEQDYPSPQVRVYPEDVALNMGFEQQPPAPCPMKGHSWAEVYHDNTVTALGRFAIVGTGETKYIQLAASSALKMMPDMAKFARDRGSDQHPTDFHTFFAHVLHPPPPHHHVAYTVDNAL